MSDNPLDNPPGITDGEEVTTYSKYKYKMINADKINGYLNMSVASRKTKTIEYELLDGRWIVFPRPQIHLGLFSKMGNWKTTRLTAIQEALTNQVISSDNVTYPGLVGTIEKDLKIGIPGLAVQADGKVLVMDEIVKDDKGLWTKAMLALTEKCEYSRDIAIGMEAGGCQNCGHAEDGHIPNCLVVKKEKPCICLSFKSRFPISYYDGRCIIYPGKVSIRSRFVSIIATMHSPGEFGRSEIGRAHLDRMVVLWFEMTDDQKNVFLREGKPLFEDQKLNPPEHVYIVKEDYQKIYDFWWKNDVGGKGGTPRQSRRLGDLVRAFSVLGKHDEDVYRELIKLGSPDIRSVKYKWAKELSGDR